MTILKEGERLGETVQKSGNGRKPVGGESKILWCASGPPIPQVENNGNRFGEGGMKPIRSITVGPEGPIYEYYSSEKSRDGFRKGGLDDDWLPD